jgi:hypothetical protein
MDSSKIKAGMPLVCAEHCQLAVVDHLESKNTIKLTKGKSGQHYYIPLSWANSIDL